MSDSLLQLLVLGAIFGMCTLPLAAALFGCLSLFGMPKSSRRRHAWVAVVFSASAVITAHAISLEGISDTVLALAIEDTTAYAPQYSALGFWCVREAITERQVAALVGRPLERYAVTSPGLYGWRWSRS